MVLNSDSSIQIQVESSTLTSSEVQIHVLCLSHYIYEFYVYSNWLTIFLEIIIVMVIIITIIVIKIITDNISTNCKIQKMFFRMSHNIFECFMKNWIIKWGFIWQISFFYSFITEHQLTSSFHLKQWLGRDGYRRYSWLKLCNWRKINMT